VSSADFPTATAMRECLSGHCGNAATFYLGRTALAYLGLRLVGAKHPVRKAFAASTAVQAFVLAWVAAGSAELPSGIAALDGDPRALLYTYLGRSAIAGSGIYLADPANKHLIRDSLAAIAPVEVAVLAWARGG